MEIEFKMAKRPDSQNNILKHILTLYRQNLNPIYNQTFISNF